MNYLQLFAKGGKTELSENEKQEGTAFLEWCTTRPEFEGFSLDEIVNALNSDKNLVETLAYEYNKEKTQNKKSVSSEKFKCGGKLQQLVSKFKNGGSVDCGCGGIKVKAEDGTNTRRFNNLPDKVYNENRILIGYMNDPAFMEWLNRRKDNRELSVMSPTLESQLNENINNSGMVLPKGQKLSIDYYPSQILTRNPNSKGMVSHIPMQQFGGITGYLGSPSNKLKVLNTIMPLLQDGGYLKSKYNQPRNIRSAFDLRALRNAKDALLRNNPGMSELDAQRAASSFVYTREPLSGPAPKVQMNTSIVRPKQIMDVQKQSVEQPVVGQTAVDISQLAKDVIRGKYGNGAQRRAALGDNYSAVQAEVARLLRKKPITDTLKPSVAETPVIVESTQTPVSNNRIIWGNLQLIPAGSTNQSSTNKTINQSARDRSMGRIEHYQRLTGADEILQEWGQSPYQNVNRESAEYREGQKQAQKEAAITTAAGIAAGIGVPAAINAAVTYAPSIIRGTGAMLRRPVRYNPSDLYRMLEASRLTPPPGALKCGGKLRKKSKKN